MEPCASVSAPASYGQKRGQGLEAALAAVFQTVGGRDAALSLGFLEKNGASMRPDGISRVSEEALVAITLLMAESVPRGRDVLNRLIVSLIAVEETES